MKTRDDKLKKMISGSNDIVEFMNGARPPSTLAINGVDDDGTTTKEFCIVDNGCYHIVHRQAISERINVLDGSNSFPALVSPTAEE
jgi:hypothetical protein